MVNFVSSVISRQNANLSQVSEGDNSNQRLGVLRGQMLKRSDMTIVGVWREPGIEIEFVGICRKQKYTHLADGQHPMLQITLTISQILEHSLLQLLETDNDRQAGGTGGVLVPRSVNLDTLVRLPAAEISARQSALSKHGESDWLGIFCDHKGCGERQGHSPQHRGPAGVFISVREAKPVPAGTDRALRPSSEWSFQVGISSALATLITFPVPLCHVHLAGTRIAF